VNNLARLLQNIIFLSSLFLASILACESLAADQFAEAAKDLAEKILKSGRLENVEFAFQSRCTLTAKDVGAARKALESELRARGVRFASGVQANAKLKITISENLRQIVWIAEIQQEQASRVVISTQARPQETPPQEIAPQMAIQMKQLFKQRDSLLDINWQGDELITLDSQKVALYRRKNDSWQLENSTPLNPPSPFPRDVRGRLFAQDASIQAYVPGLSCSGSIQSSLTLNCSQESRAWPIGVDNLSSKYQVNYFLSENLPPFYSAASTTDDGVDLLAIAGVDGRAYLNEKAARQVGAIDNWGDEIASIEAGCGAGKPILVSLPRDPMERGAIQAFEIVHRKPVVVSSIVEFPGPVTALWAIRGQNAAIAVARNLKTGNYAAFHLSISCSR
jgi:hypothetical protein